jgi:hypothetical protein
VIVSGASAERRRKDGRGRFAPAVATGGWAGASRIHRFHFQVVDTERVFGWGEGVMAGNVPPSTIPKGGGWLAPPADVQLCRGLGGARRPPAAGAFLLPLPRLGVGQVRRCITARDIWPIKPYALRLTRSTRFRCVPKVARTEPAEMSWRVGSL